MNCHHYYSDKLRVITVMSICPLSVTPPTVLPSRLGDHHLSPETVELIPQLLLVQGHFGIIVDCLVLWHGYPGRDASEGEAR